MFLRAIDCVFWVALFRAFSLIFMLCCSMVKHIRRTEVILKSKHENNVRSSRFDPVGAEMQTRVRN